jgi:hypothetical protein
MNDLRLEEKARKRMTCSTLTVANQVINDYTNRSAGSIAVFHDISNSVVAASREAPAG